VASGFTGAILIALFGCSHFRSSAKPEISNRESPSVIEAERYCLLYKLMSQEKNLPKLLIVKNESAPVREFVKKIGHVAEAAEDKIESFAKQESGISLKADPLPLIEREARKSAEKARTKELLSARGSEFELRLILSQLEALNYAVHLSSVLAEREGIASRRDFFSALADNLRKLCEEGLDLIPHAIGTARKN
jgi:hypothetical protein